MQLHVSTNTLLFSCFLLMHDIAVAYKRFSDVIPQEISAEFLGEFASSLEIALRSMDVSAERCQAFLAEDPETKRHRLHILDKKRRLQDAKNQLDRIFIPVASLPGTSNPPSPASTLPNLPSSFPVSSSPTTTPEIANGSAQYSPFPASFRRAFSTFDSRQPR